MNLMEPFSREELKILTQRQTGLCISVFMPIYRAGADSQQNQIRFKNLLRQAEEKMTVLGLRLSEAKTVLEPAYALVSNVIFWRNQSDGLALFLSPELFRYYCLPTALEESLAVTDRFYIKPLLPVLSLDERFLVLTLSQNQVKLYEGTRQHLREFEVKGIPKNLSEALDYDEPEKQVRFRSGSSGGERGNMVSGHGAEIEDVKENLAKYFRQVDKALHSALKNERLPLILAGV
ncbi:MAG: hypothetical protein PHY31_10620, partial [Smithellaceae bacterium]|nr:hypothetical protein [Smithellaceae bacterium]